PDQPSGTGGGDGSGGVQGALADRTAVQGAQAKSAHQNFRGHQRQCAEDPNLDSTDRAASCEIPAIAVHFLLESFAIDRLVTPTVVCLPRSVALAGVALRAAGAAQRSRFAAGPFRVDLVMLGTCQPLSSIPED